MAAVPNMRPWRCGLRCLKTGKHVPRVTCKVAFSDKTHLDSITISHPTYLCQLITVLDSRLEIIFKSDCTYGTWDWWRTITDLTADEPAMHVSEKLEESLNTFFILGVFLSKTFLSSFTTVKVTQGIKKNGRG